LIGLLLEYNPYEKVALLHSDTADCAQVLLQEIRDILPDGEILLAQINPVLGVHIGSEKVSFVDISKR